VKKKYVNVTVGVPEELHEIAAALLSDLPFTGIVENMDEIIICFEEKDWNETTKQLILDELVVAIPNVKIIAAESLDDKNWNEEWEKHVQAVKISDKIGIAPTHRIHELDTELKIEINPKMSFGTGHHATTRLVGRLMENQIFVDKDVVDVGTGTGALAIIAAKLGAKSVYAFDNNDWSVDNAEENFNINGVGDFIKLENADIDSIDLNPYHYVIANLFTPLILSSMPKFASSVKQNSGNLICSGIMIYDKDAVVKRAEEFGFKLVEFLTEDEWIAFHFSLKAND